MDDPEVTQVPRLADPEVTRAPKVDDSDVTRVPQAADPDVTRAPAAAPQTDDHETQIGGQDPTRRSRSGIRSGSRPGSRPGTRPGQTSSGFGEAAADLVGRSLGPRYQIIKMLGAGGMGAVYQAWDQDLGVVVALKTVRPEVTANPETARQLERRFKQELLLARQVTHKNIVRVHDIGEVDGIKYITMPYIEGEDLSTILKREGKLPVERVMTIARQVASGSRRRARGRRRASRSQARQHHDRRRAATP